MNENIPQTLADVKAGDEVVMIYRTGSKTHGKSDDHVVRAVVTDAKRVNLSITEKDQASSRARTWYVRRDTGTDKARSARGGLYGWKAYTVAQHEHNERRSAAGRTLRRHGINIDSSSPWRGREIELLDLLTQHVEQVHSHARIINHPSNGDLLRAARGRAS